MPKHKSIKVLLWVYLPFEIKKVFWWIVEGVAEKCQIKDKKFTKSLIIFYFLVAFFKSTS